jgi:hypothetical protein
MEKRVSRPREKPLAASRARPQRRELRLQPAWQVAALPCRIVAGNKKEAFI